MREHFQPWWSCRWWEHVYYPAAYNQPAPCVICYDFEEIRTIDQRGMVWGWERRIGQVINGVDTLLLRGTR